MIYFRRGAFAIKSGYPSAYDAPPLARRAGAVSAAFWSFEA